MAFSALSNSLFYLTWAAGFTIYYLLIYKSVLSSYKKLNL